MHLERVRELIVRDQLGQGFEAVPGTEVRFGGDIDTVVILE